MEHEGISLPLIHNHLLMPCNYHRKGDCCGRFDSVSDGFYCKTCDFFLHKKCSEPSESIEHPSHPAHALKLELQPLIHACDACGNHIMTNLLYLCEICDFDVGLCCATYPPPEVVDVSETHVHKLTLVKRRIKFQCSASTCVQKEGYGYSYKCHECDLDFHVACVWNPPHESHTYDSEEGISLPLIDDHPLMPCKDLRRGDCCGRFELTSEGFYCKTCDIFLHKECVESSKSIQHSSHSAHVLVPELWPINSYYCDACGNNILTRLVYHCKFCYFNVGMCCAKYPPPQTVDVSEMHDHKITLVQEKTEFQCSASTCTEKDGDGFSYKCHECDLDFHVSCVWIPPHESHPYEPTSEVNHSYHSLHSLKLLMASSLPHSSDSICRLCGKDVDEFCYHCSSCNFTLDMCCVLNPPPRTLLDLKAHGHQITLLSRLDSFTCNACGLSGDRSPYVCLQCDFFIHQTCIGLPRVININRHDHRVSRVFVLGVENSVCGVCRHKVDKTCGGYSCRRCPGYVVHSRCATRNDVWNGEELDGVPEEIEDIEPYVVIDENTIKHFSHEEHYLRFQVGGFRYEDNKWCKACIQPISLQSFYGCMDCDFLLHKSCAELPKQKRHVLHNERLTLVTSEADYFYCGACKRGTNGFMYKHGNKKLDVICSSVSEPFVHPSHPHHPLYYIPTDTGGVCNGCKKESSQVLRCVENDCEFMLDFKCATIPQEVKHKVEDHPLSLCYEEKASGNYWCYICEKQTDPEKWFYTCKDHWASLHTECVFGDFARFMPGSTIENYNISFEVVLNNSASRPCCRWCKLRCIHPIILKLSETSDKYFCALTCTFLFSLEKSGAPDPFD